MGKLRFGLVGCGNIARKHAHAITEHLEDAEIAAFVDSDISRAQQFSTQYGAPAFASIADMVRAVGREIDVFSVLTPSGITLILPGPDAPTRAVSRALVPTRLVSTRTTPRPDWSLNLPPTACRSSSRNPWRSGSKTPTA